MASICHSISLPPLSNSNPTAIHNKLKTFCPFFPIPNSISHSNSTISFRSSRIQATPSTSSTAVGDSRGSDEDSMSVDNLHRFFQLNSGKWNGSFFQFDARGNLLHEISTKLAVSSYGEDELISLIQTLYIKQPQSSFSVSGNDDEPEWTEYKIKETNMFTVDKYQQIGFFPSEKAFSLRYQTAGMLETVLRQGVLGEDDTGEESPKNLKLPSRQPSIVCENCLYFPGKDLRARAFHIMDPKGNLEMLLIFLEEKADEMLFHPSLDINLGKKNRLMPFLGNWKGHSITKRSGVYGSTISEANTVSSLQMDNNGQIIQDITTTTSSNGDVTTNVHWTGTKSDNLITFDGGYQLTLLPGGMYMGCPCDIAKSVAESKSFHMEFCWLEAPGRRQRLVRTYDIEGLAVSSTYFSEVKL